MKKHAPHKGKGFVAERGPVPIRFIEYGEFESWTSLAPGSARWVVDLSDDIAGINFTCPGGCGRVQFCHVYPEGGEKKKRVAWAWNGDHEKPTLKPSILSVRGWGGCGWHGYLTDGVFQVLPSDNDQCQGPRK